MSEFQLDFFEEKHFIGGMPTLVVCFTPEWVRLVQDILRQSKTWKKNGNFSLLVEEKVLCESEFVGFEVFTASLI